MVSLDGRLAEIRKMIDRKYYFAMNRGRQLGKTTTLAALKQYLQEDFIVVSLDFQFLSQADFEAEQTFSTAFARRFALALRRVPEAAGEALDRIKKYGDGGCTLSILFEGLSEFCASAPKPVVLLIDEVDSASNIQVFLDFLALLRGYYLQREDFPTFQSVILAGVYDIRNLKQKVRPDSEHKHNSPWNIAAAFDVNMDLEADGIAGMLTEYEADYHTGMDVRRMAQLLYEETCGYPFLVSRLCQLMDEQIPGSGEPVIRGLLLWRQQPLTGWAWWTRRC